LLHKYNTICENNLRRPSLCKKCKKSRFHKHSRYSRSILFSRTKEFLFIIVYRYRCVDCKHVISVFPKGCFKYRRALVSASAAAFRESASAASIIKTRPVTTPRTIFRWRMRFRRFAEKHLQQVIKFIFLFHPEVDVKAVSKNQHPLEQLTQLISQFNPSNDIEILIILLELQNADRLWN